MKNNKSQYSASFTAASMMFSEMRIVVSMLLEDNSCDTRKKLREEVQYLQIQSVSARDRVTTELTKRFDAMQVSFWGEYLTLPEDRQRLALFFVILKTYKLLSDFQMNVALPKFNSVDRTICVNDILMRMNEIASGDEFVANWTDNTKKKTASTYITILRQTGLVNDKNELATPSVPDDTLVQYIKSGDDWFLQACFIPQYRINQIKQGL